MNSLRGGGIKWDQTNYVDRTRSGEIGSDKISGNEIRSDETTMTAMRSKEENHVRPAEIWSNEIKWDQRNCLEDVWNEMLILNFSTCLFSEDLSHEFQLPVLRTIPVFPVAMYQNGLRTYEPRLWTTTKYCNLVTTRIKQFKRAGQYFAYRSVSFFEHSITSSPTAKYAWWNYKNSTKQMRFAAVPLNHPWTMDLCTQKFEMWWYTIYEQTHFPVLHSKCDAQNMPAFIKILGQLSSSEKHRSQKTVSVKKTSISHFTIWSGF